MITTGKQKPDGQLLAISLRSTLKALPQNLVRQPNQDLVIYSNFGVG